MEMDVIKNICRMCLRATPDNRIAYFASPPSFQEIEEFEKVKKNLQTLMFTQKVSVFIVNY